MSLEELIPDAPNFGNLSDEERRWIYQNFTWLNENVNKDFFTEVAKGRIPGHAAVFISGHNQSVGTVLEDISAIGGSRVWPQSAGLIELASTDANDTAAGSGARSVLVQGLDENWDEIEEEVATNGLSYAATTKNFIRFNKAIVTAVGSYTAPYNAGTITIRMVSTGDVQGTININDGASLDAYYSVPRDKIALIQNVAVAVDSNQDAAVHAFARLDADLVTAPFGPVWHFQRWPGVVGFLREEFHAPIRLPGKSDLWLAGASSASTSAIQVSYGLILVDKGYFEG